MLVLLSILSWVGAATNGDAQAQRDTFLQNVSCFPNVKYKFFIGDGTATGEDETESFSSFDKPWWCNPEYKARALDSLARTPFTYVPKDDEVLLPVPDGYAHLVWKFRAACRWALNENVDYMFYLNTDIYVDVARLLGSGFEKYDHVGRGNGYHPGVSGELINGGGGCWLSRRLMELVAVAPITVWAEDVWLSAIAVKNGLLQRTDGRYSSDYAAGEPAPRADNDVINAHLGPNTPKSAVRYDRALMYKVHRERQ